MKPFTCLAGAWVNGSRPQCSRERVGITAEFGPTSPNLLTSQGILFLLRNPGDRMGSAPTNCLISRFLPGAKLRNCIHACVSFYRLTTGYSINNREGLGEARLAVSKDLWYLAAMGTWHFFFFYGHVVTNIPACLYRADPAEPRRVAGLGSTHKWLPIC